ncbi:TGF-beta domain-containing family member maverick isoform X2 [Rhodnius prolixus]
MNVSQEEYVKMVDVYLRRLHKRSLNPTKQLLTFLHSGAVDAQLLAKRSLVFRTNLTKQNVESATLRMIVKAVKAENPKASGKSTLLVYERLSDGSRPLIASTELQTYLLPKWTDIDVQRSSLSGEVRFELDCDRCRMSVDSASLNVMVDSELRAKRQAPTNQTRNTDCVPGAKKNRCCRHRMEIMFKDMPGYEFVIQPYYFDAGYCHGGCPYRYNPASHHSSLQSILNKQNSSLAPRPCCAPSKLVKMDILHLDEYDNSKLKVSAWSNLKALECACA